MKGKVVTSVRVVMAVPWVLVLGLRFVTAQLPTDSCSHHTAMSHCIAFRRTHSCVWDTSISRCVDDVACEHREKNSCEFELTNGKNAPWDSTKNKVKITDLELHRNIFNIGVQKHLRVLASHNPFTIHLVLLGFFRQQMPLDRRMSFRLFAQKLQESRLLFSKEMRAYRSEPWRLSAAWQRKMRKSCSFVFIGFTFFRTLIFFDKHTTIFE